MQRMKNIVPWSVAGALAITLGVTACGTARITSAAPPKPVPYSQPVGHFGGHWTPAHLSALRAEIVDHRLNH
jgi:hypothetical protein